MVSKCDALAFAPKNLPRPSSTCRRLSRTECLRNFHSSGSGTCCFSRTRSILFLRGQPQSSALRKAFAKSISDSLLSSLDTGLSLRFPIAAPFDKPAPYRHEGSARYEWHVAAKTCREKIPAAPAVQTKTYVTPRTLRRGAH